MLLPNHFVGRRVVATLRAKLAQGLRSGYFKSMFGPVDTRMPQEVEEQVASIHQQMYPDGDQTFVARSFDWAGQCFGGRYADYQAIDAQYHDFEHTLQGTLCLARLLWGRHEAGAEPGISQSLFELSILAILFHDTGYLKKRSDANGTGAKYTYTHVGRSADFARGFLAAKGYSVENLDSISNMIRCTGVNADLAGIPFRSDLERTLGYALATADLLGQMAARDYIDKLPVLFLEFAEAAASGGDTSDQIRAYKSVEELMRNTDSFWRNYVVPKINHDFGGIYRFLNQPYPDGPNPYMERIENNLSRLNEKIRRQLAP
jgi:hypothetical protein